MRTPDDVVVAVQQASQNMIQASQQINYEVQSLVTALKDIKSVFRQHAEFLNDWLERAEAVIKKEDHDS